MGCQIRYQVTVSILNNDLAQYLNRALVAIMFVHVFLEIGFKKKFNKVVLPNEVKHIFYFKYSQASAKILRSKGTCCRLAFDRAEFGSSESAY